MEMWTMLIYAVVIFGFMYFVMIRPENKRKKKLEEMRNNLKEGMVVTTIGGIIGTIVSVTENYVVIETSDDRVRLQLAKWAIGGEGKQQEETQK